MSLITTIAELKKYIRIDANSRIEGIQPFIDEAETLYIIDLISEAQHSTLQAAYTAAGNDIDVIADADLKALMPYVQRALAYYTYYLAVTQLGSQVGDLGIIQQRGEDSDPAPKWKVDALTLNYIQSADTHANKLLGFLEENATVTKYNDWYASSANTIAEGLILRSTAKASLHIDISDSRRIFLRMKKHIMDIERNIIRRLIGQGQYDELVVQIKSDSVTAVNTSLIEKLEPVIAKMALYRTIPFMRVSITDTGITVYSSNDGVIQKQQASDTAIKALMHSLKMPPSGYEADENEFRYFITENIADYPLIEASSAWTSKADPGPKHEIENSSDNKYFAV